MKKVRNHIFLLFICFFLINNQEAQAYINPGSGSYIFQTVIGGILSIVYLIKKCFLWIVNLFRRKSGNNDKND